MPSAPDHYRFALRVFSDAAAGRLSVPQAVSAHPGLVIIGSQGPDPFYFYGEVPWRRRSGAGRAAAFAEFLHGSDPLELFPPLAQQAALAASRAGDRPEAAFAYLFGLLLHYTLDRAVHPYVYFRSGFDGNGELGGRFSALHAMFETMMAESAGGGAPVSETAPARMFAADPSDLAVADGLFAAAFPGRVDSGQFSTAWSDMATALEVLWDPTGIKRLLLASLGGRRTRTYSMIRPCKAECGAGADYLNAGKASWRHPVSGVESKASVAELTAAAETDAAAAAGLLDQLIRGEPVDWSGLLRGVNHEGHRPNEIKRFSAPV